MGDGSLESVAVACPVFDGSAESPASIVVSDGHVITGAVVSSTVIIWTQEDVFPQASSAVQVRVIASGRFQHGSLSKSRLEMDRQSLSPWLDPCSTEALSPQLRLSCREDS